MPLSAVTIESPVTTVYRMAPNAAAATRINRHAVLQAPANLPVREIQLTEYWMNK